jgi:hypothetical protein
MQSIDWVTGRIMGSAMRIHSALGPGHFESVDEVVLERRSWRIPCRTAEGDRVRGAPLREAGPAT